jgi:hypothetical protein
MAIAGQLGHTQLKTTLKDSTGANRKRLTRKAVTAVILLWENVPEK